MADFAQKLAKNAKKGDAFGLKGTLGAGKSFFASEFINALSDEKVEVLSPTFNLVYDYQTASGQVFHFDLYRLKSAEELENIGFFENLSGGISLIEWPEIAQKFLQRNYTQIEIDFVENEGEEVRLLTIS